MINVGGPAAGALAVLALVVWFSIFGKWSPGWWFYAGVLMQGIYVAKFLFGSELAAERFGIASVLLSGTFFALDARASASASSACSDCAKAATVTTERSKRASV